MRDRACRRAVLIAAQLMAGKGLCKSQTSSFLCSLSEVAESVVEY